MNASDPNNAESVNSRAIGIYVKERTTIYRKTDRLFAVLMPIQWIAAIIAAAYSTGEGSKSIWIAVVVGGAIAAIPTALAIAFPGESFTRYVISICQMLMSSFLIHFNEGSIETHFHIFGSLAFLALYRDWRVLIPATMVTGLDHFFYESLFTMSPGELAEEAGSHRLYHIAWVLFADVFLVYSCITTSNRLREVARNTAALDDSEARYRAVVEQITEGIFLLSPESLNVIECNDAFAKLIGYDSVEEVRQLNAFDFDPVKPEEIEVMTKIARNENRSHLTQRKYKRKDGSHIFVELLGRYITYGESTAYCINVRDITERIENEIEIKRLALVAQKTQNAVIITDPNGLIQWVNPGFTRITGYEIDEVIGKKPGKLLQGSETDLETVLDVRDAIRHQMPYVGEIYNYGKDGRGYWISISIMPIHNEEGAHKGFIAVEMDISDRKEIEAELRQARDEMEARVATRTTELLEANQAMAKEVDERKRVQIDLSEAQQFLRKVIDNIPNLIFVKDTSGRYILANQAFASSYGKKVMEVIGKTDAELIGHLQDVEKYNQSDRRVLDEQIEVVIDEDKFIDADGNTRWLQSIKRPFHSNLGSQYVLGIATDLTERKMLESQLQNAQKLESIGQLAAGIAHEINTPTQYVGDNTRFVRDAVTDIFGVLGKYAELLEKVKKGDVNPNSIAGMDEIVAAADLEYLQEEVPSAIRQSLEGVSRIAKIVQSMKDFAHPGSKEKTAVDLNRAIESTITVARNEWKYVAEMETHLDPTLPPVPCLLGEFNQVVLNMVINASHAIQDVVGDASRGKGKITISTTKVSDDWAEIRIADTGSGIPPSAQSKVFDPFFTTKEVGKGTGQGLAISHTVVVEKHHGRIKFETEQGKGTTFIIQLPLNPTENNEEKRGVTNG